MGVMSEDAEREFIKALIAEHGMWNDHPDHPMEQWQRNVEHGLTLLGYWHWVARRIQSQRAMRSDSG